MNCKPGDLAVVVRANMDATDKELLGVVRQLTKCIPHPENGKPLWEFKGERVFISCSEVTAIADWMLQPIRGLGVPKVVECGVGEYHG